MIVYITINLINGKKYIGKDVANRRYYLGSNYESNAYLIKVKESLKTPVSSCIISALVHFKFIKASTV